MRETMLTPAKGKPLKKELTLLDVYTIAAGTTLSAGFFLLPGLAAAQVGSAMVLAYLVAAIPLIPAMFSVIELATAMPRAGGVYYFLDRTLGPYFGMIGGFGTWLALVLKVSFALIGMGAYVAIFFPSLPITPIAVLLALALGVLNYFGARKTGRLQMVLVFGLLAILCVFVVGGLPHIQPSHFDNLLGVGVSPIVSTAGMVYISYVGVTKVASLSEEVKDPERNLPLGVILALATAIAIYAMGTAVMAGVVPAETLAGDLTPAATAAGIFLGRPGVILLSIAALLAFVSVANAGTMSASRYPLAMSRDHLVPPFLRHLSARGTPTYSLILTVGTIVAILVALDPVGIAKLASAFQLLMFALVCFAVIVMRESKIVSYDPGYLSPLYPWMQILGILTSIWLISEIGPMPLLFSIGLILVGTLWYERYARARVSREGAIFHVFERLGRRRYEGLDGELRGILKEKGLREGDPFDRIVTRARTLDLTDETQFETVVEQVAERFAEVAPHTKQEFVRQLMEGTRVGATPVTHGIALPHLRVDGIEHAEMVLVRARKGVHITLENPLTDEVETMRVHALFFLASPETDPAQHLRILARIAGRVEEESFAEEWENAVGEQALKEALLHNDRFVSLKIAAETKTEFMLERPICEIPFPKGCLVALIQREDGTIIPKGYTVLQEADRLTVIGEPFALKELERLFGD